MRELGIISPDFPRIHAPVINAAASTEPGGSPCGCPKHSMPPQKPEALPFAPVEENVERMKAWLIEFFAGFTFNICPHQPQPMMKTEPIRIHIDPNAVPKPAYTAATVPIHLREPVSAQIKEDLAMGVIEKVPPGHRS